METKEKLNALRGFGTPAAVRSVTVASTSSPSVTV